MSTASVTIDVHLTDREWRDLLAAECVEGLTATAKTLSPVWFYDEVGSGLFDEITRLPEYYPTRAEREILVQHAAGIASAADASVLVEIGSGTSDKTRHLLHAMDAHGGLDRYVPFDVSESTVREAAASLGDEFGGLDVHAVIGDFHRHLSEIPRGGRRLVAFLGGTIGNLTPAERRRFLFDLDCAMGADDHFLLGVDLVKDRDLLVQAYDDAAGVTAAFNRNALANLNATFGADFDPAAFDHVARWNEDESRIEIYLRSTRDQQVTIPVLDVEIDFARGEELRTEISCKFTPERLEAELWDAGFVLDQTWHAEPGYLLALSHPYC